MKRIFSYTPTYLPHIGGAELTVYNLNRHLRRMGVHILNCFPGEKYVYEENKVLSFKDIKRHPVLKLIYRNIVITFLFLKHRKNVTHIVVHYALHAPLLILLARALGIPVLACEYHFGFGTDDDLRNYTFIEKYYFRFIYKRVNVIQTISRKNLVWLRQFTNTAAEVVHQGVDLEKFRAISDIERNSNQFISIGRIVKRKRVSELFDFFMKYSRPEDVLLYVGRSDAGSEEYFEQVNKHDGVRSGKICVLTNVDSEELVELLSASTCLLSFSKLEGFGLTFLEAIACNCRVLALKNSSWEEFQDGSILQCFEYDEKGLKSMANKLHINSIESYHFEHFIKVFGWNNYACRILNILNNA